MQTCTGGAWVDDAVESSCVDDGDWADSYGDACDSTWYAGGTNCDTASNYADANGVDATMACCICGGGTTEGTNCTGTDVCVNGQTQEGATVCGLNDEGVLVQDCTDGQWADNETCTGTD